MTMTVSASDAQSRFGSMLRYAEENQGGVVVERRGKPAAVIISYPEYEAFTKLRKQEKRKKALQTLKEIRQRVQERNPDLAAEVVYRMAGFSEDVIQSTLQKDEELATKQ